jgi:hypothetical protein
MPANHTPWGAVAAVLAVALTAQIASAQPALESEPAWTPAEVLVVGTPPSSRAEARALSSQDPFSVRELARNRGVKVTRARAAFQGPSATRAFPGGAWVLSLETGVDPVQAARLLAQDPAVLYAGPNHVWKIGTFLTPGYEVCEARVQRHAFLPAICARFRTRTRGMELDIGTGRAHCRDRHRSRTRSP